MSDYVARTMIRHLESHGCRVEVLTGPWCVRASAVDSSWQSYQVRVEGGIYLVVCDLAQAVDAEIDDG